MACENAQFGFTDMPYNLAMRDISSDADREEFAFAHGEMSPHEFTRFQTTFMRHKRKERARKPPRVLHEPPLPARNLQSRRDRIWPAQGALHLDQESARNGQPLQGADRADRVLPERRGPAPEQYQSRPSRP